MKKGLTILMAMIVITGLLCIIGSAGADDRNVGSSFVVSGNGLIDVSLEVNTGNYYSGLALSQHLYTPSLGMAGNSYLEYRSEFALGIYNVSEGNQTLDLTYTEDGMASNVRHGMYIKNYVIGSSAGFKYTGNATQTVEAYTDNTLSEISIDGRIEGKMKLHQKVIEPGTGVVISREINELEGKYEYSWNAYAGLIDDGKERGDWLGCP